MRHAKRQAMAQSAAQEKAEKNKRAHPIIRSLVTLIFLVFVSFAGYQAVVHPDTPLPAAWNPMQPLQISDPVTPITSWKLSRAAADGETCRAVLQGAAGWQNLPDLATSEQCHIRDRISLSTVGQTQVAPFETRCAIALRMAMWEKHTLQPAAQEFFGTQLTGIDHFGSYSCRRLRTTSGPSARMSTHATADAIDIAGFRLADGRSLRLLDHWNGSAASATFLRAARDGACKWFSLTLSPDYNRLHADHFHLQSTGWGFCR